MDRFRHIALLAALVLATSACSWFSSVLHDDSVVAKVGEHKLYKSEVVKLIPTGLPEQDSLTMARQYIQSWASDHVFLDVAEQQLSEQEKDVTEELENYRSSLLKYRYEQLYIAQRLSRDVSDEEVKAFYDAHLKNYVLDLPVAKSRILRIASASPYKEHLKGLLTTSDPTLLAELDSLSNVMCEKYIDHSSEWVNLVDIGRQVGVDYGTILSKINHNYAELDDESGRLYMIFFVDFIRSGEQAPVEYCQQSIKETILSIRKRELIRDLEEELLEKARQNGEFEIYE